MTKLERELQCHLLRDLLVPYIAGDVSEPTRNWIDQHLADCDECRHALAEWSGDQLPAPPAVAPSAVPGQRLVRRLRLTVWGVLGIIMALLLAIGGLTWSVAAIKRVAGLPDVHPVPLRSLQAAQAAAVDLAPLGLSQTDLTTESFPVDGFDEGATATYANPQGQQVRVSAYRFVDAKAARRFVDRTWVGLFPSRMFSFENKVGSKSVGKFRSNGDYYYSWSADGWFIAIAVNGAMSDPAQVRDQVRDLLFIAYTRS